MTVPQEYEHIKQAFEAEYRRGVRHHRMRTVAALGMALGLGSFGNLFSYGLSHHITGVWVPSIVGAVGLTAAYWLSWFASDPVRRVNLSPVLDRSGGEEGSGGDVEPLR